MMPSFAHAGCLFPGKGGKSGFAGSRPFHFLFFGGFSESRRRKARQGLFMVSGRTGAELLSGRRKDDEEGCHSKVFCGNCGKEKRIHPGFC